jgi:hypothetical protein
VVDLTTGASSQGFVTDAPITISFGGTGTAEVFEMGEGRAWEGNIRVVHWPSTELAAGEWALHVSEPPGSVTFEFVPTGDLAVGWYAIQVDFDAINEARGAGPPYDRGLRLDETRPVIDGWTTTRLHVGSLPIVRLGGTIFERTSGGFVIQPSEVVRFSSDVDLIDGLIVHVDGRPWTCRDPNPESGSTLFGPTSGRTWSGVTVACDAAPTGGHVTVGFTPELVEAAGGLLLDIHGNSPPAWSFRVSENAEGDGQPADALFERRRALSADGAAEAP